MWINCKRLLVKNVFTNKILFSVKYYSAYIFPMNVYKRNIYRENFSESKNPK